MPDFQRLVAAMLAGCLLLSPVEVLWANVPAEAGPLTHEVIGIPRAISDEGPTAERIRC